MKRELGYKTMQQTPEFQKELAEVIMDQFLFNCEDAVQACHFLSYSKAQGDVDVW